MNASTSQRSALLVPLLLTIIVGGSAVIIFVTGYHYYTSPSEARLFTAEHRVFGSAGFIGLICGIVATLLFMSNLFYLVRKRYGFKQLGTLRTWLNWHVVSGLLGATLVALHSAFELRTLVAQTAVWAMAVVLVTGLVGRYMVRFIPRSDQGEELGLEALEKDVLAFVDELRPAVVGDSRAIALLQEMMDRLYPKGSGQEHWLSGLLRLRRLKRDLAHLRHIAKEHAQPECVDRLMEQTQRTWRYLVLARVASQMMQSWRIFHRVIALLFLLAVTVHIIGVFYYGFATFDLR